MLLVPRQTQAAPVADTRWPGVASLDGPSRQAIRSMRQAAIAAQNQLAVESLHQSVEDLKRHNRHSAEHSHGQGRRPLSSMPTVSMHPPRFRVGDRVRCRMGPSKWAAGEVVTCCHREHSFPPNTSVPYLVRLDEGVRIHVPADDDEIVRRENPEPSECGGASARLLTDTWLQNWTEPRDVIPPRMSPQAHTAIARAIGAAVPAMVLRLRARRPPDATTASDAALVHWLRPPASPPPTSHLPTPTSHLSHTRICARMHAHMHACAHICTQESPT